MRKDVADRSVGEDILRTRIDAAIRLNPQVTQADVAAALGISGSAFSRLLSGENKGLTYTRVRVIADTIGVPWQTLTTSGPAWGYWMTDRAA